MLTIVMYHYVRDLAHSRYPAIKGLTTERFEGQLDYLARHYQVVSLAQIHAAARDAAPLPANALLLSFDDGFADHYLTVYPRLAARGWTGCFFPPAEATLEHKMLDVHKIHFVLASCPEPAKLVGRILELAAAARTQEAPDLPESAALRAAWTKPGRFDGPDVVFIKTALQQGLPQPLRGRIVDRLFAEYVSPDEGVFARELYMDLAQMRQMNRSGMEFGGHGSKHVWLGRSDRALQQSEIAACRTLLTRINERDGPPDPWAMCYPYGDYNADTLELLRAGGCVLGLTTRVELARDLSRPMELPRLDTNDLPCSAAAPPCPWTLCVAG
jgi:peptidoglycan/xylan/chitin deacetylase (PgdA/CDA1 family)